MGHRATSNKLGRNNLAREPMLPEGSVARSMSKPISPTNWLMKRGFT